MFHLCSILVILCFQVIQIKNVQINNQAILIVGSSIKLVDSSVSKDGMYIYALIYSQNSYFINQYQIKDGFLEEKTKIKLFSTLAQFSNLLILNEYILWLPVTNQPIQLYNKYLNKIKIDTVETFIISRAIYLQKTELIIFSTCDGRIGSTTLDQLIHGKFTPIMYPSKHSGNTYLSHSPNQQYFASTDITSNTIYVWCVYTQSILFQFQIQQTDIRAHCWSADSSILMITTYVEGYLYIFKLSNKMILYANFSTNLSQITKLLYYYETNEVVALSSTNNSQLFTINLNNYQMNIILILNQTIKMNDNNKYSVSLLNESSIISLTLQQICLDGQYFNNTLNLCISCGKFCKFCNPYICLACNDTYINLDSWNCYQQQKSVQNTNYFSINPTAFYSSAFSALNSTMQIPGSRQSLNFLFSFFSNFDHLVLYNYHKRTYGTGMKQILTFIHGSIDYRFQIINNQLCNKYLGIDFGAIQNDLDFRANYSLSTFILLQNNGEGFLQNNLQYFFLNIPLIIILLILFKTIFSVLYQYKISAYFRKYSFTSIIFLLLLDGNIQIFTFNFTGDFLAMFSMGLQQKLLNIFTIICFFIMLIMCTSGFFSYYITYKKQSYYLYENCKSIAAASHFYMLSYGCFNILRGFTHRITVDQPIIQCLILFFIQIVDTTLIYQYYKKTQLFRNIFLCKLTISVNFSRMCLIISLLLMQNKDYGLTMDYVQQCIFLYNVISFFIGTIVQAYEVIVYTYRLYFKSEEDEDFIQQQPNINSYNKSHFFQKNKVTPSQNLKANVKKHQHNNKPHLNIKFCLKNIQNAQITFQDVQEEDLRQKCFPFKRQKIFHD